MQAPKQFFLTLLLALATGVTMAGCGDSDNNTASSSSGSGGGSSSGGSSSGSSSGGSSSGGSSSGSSSGGAVVLDEATQIDGSKFDWVDSIFFGNVADGNTAAGDQVIDDTDDPEIEEDTWLAASQRGNQFVDPNLIQPDFRSSDWDLRPGTASPATDCPNASTRVPELDDAFFCGAFGEDNWMAEWVRPQGTQASDYPNPLPPFELVADLPEINQGDFNRLTQDLTLTNDTIWVIDRPIRVAEGTTLTVEAGTFVVGFGVSYVEVERGGILNAVGEATAPVVFTAFNTLLKTCRLKA